MLDKIKDLLFSTKLMAVLLLSYAIAMGVATFVENDFGTIASKAMVYNATWFEVIQVLLVISFIGNIFRYKLLRKEKWSILLFHIAFIVILIGAAITRYYGYEGTMHIREGAQSNLLTSDKIYLSFRVDDNSEQRTYYKELLLSSITNNDFSEDYDFKGQNFEVDYVDFVPRATMEIVPNSGNQDFLSLVVSGSTGREDKLLEKGKSILAGGQVISWDNMVPNAINIITDGNSLKITSPQPINILRMMDKYEGTYPQDSLVNFDQRILYMSSGISIVLQNIHRNASIEYKSDPDKKSQKLDRIVVDVKMGEESKRLELFGGKGNVLAGNIFSMGGLNFNAAYGSVYIQVPFSLKLNDFQLERYPGSNSPASFASEVTLLDGHKQEDHRIFMNNVLDYRGYRFFQSSYDTDEKGTILSVNHDFAGTLVTYLGYLLLAIGMMWTLFAPRSRFMKLNEQLKVYSSKAGIIVLFALLSNYSWAQAPDQHMYDNIDSILETKFVSKAHADEFGSLLIQDNGGRIKPLNTFASELMRKVYRKDNYNGYDADQVLLSMLSFPIEWQFVKIIKIDSKTQVDELLGIEGENYARFFDFFNEDGSYKLSKAVEEAYQLKSSQRGTFEKEIIKVDERVNIFYLTYQGSLLKLFPIPGDQNNKWETPVGDLTSFVGEDSLFVSRILPWYFSNLKQAIQTNDYAEADAKIQFIKLFQKKYGSKVLPSESKVKYELMYNKYQPFQKLFPIYMMLGFFLLVVSFVKLFKNSKIVNFISHVIVALIGLGFLMHTFGLGVRWYISGHAPWSNGYESMIYISWATILAGFLFAKKSKISLSATALLSALILMVSHLNWLDPEVTNIVPVLNSYWLMIHVAIITASYGFVGLGAILGFLVLLIYMFANEKSKSRLEETIKELTIINEMTLTIGLFLLTIGTFLGGVWANESWGRYWGWDPKETWAFVSVFVYAFVLHMRLVPGLKGKYLFNLISIVAFSSIIMTYFGVNYYLSGLHSYAAGDPMPIPSFVYYTIAIVFVVGVISYWRKRKLNM